MKPNTIRLIDLYAGRLICFLLTSHRFLWELFSHGKRSALPLRKVLFIKLVEQGATVLAYSAIKEAIERFGRENVFFCVFEENQAILHAMDMIPKENILIVRNSNLVRFSQDIVKLLLQARKIGIDATIDMEFFARASAILSYLIGAPYRVGLHRFSSETPYRGDLMTHRLQYNPYLHTAKSYLLLVKALGMDPQDLPLLKYPTDNLTVLTPSFIPTDEERNQFLARLKNDGLFPFPGPIILLNPNASDMLPLRKWSSSNFVRLGQEILQAFPDVTLIITGAPSEAASAEAISREISSPRVFALAGKTTIRELLILYTLADVLVTNDSGPGHFASLTGIHSIVLFGPETPRLFGAIGGNFHPIAAELACSPCVNVYNHRFSPCKHNRCMEAIKVDHVFEIVTDCLCKKS